MGAMPRIKPQRDWTSSTPNELRKRKQIELTLSDEAMTALEAMAERYGKKRSRIVEAILLDVHGMSEAKRRAILAGNDDK
jgi:hypothetical protein